MAGEALIERVRTLAGPEASPLQREAEAALLRQGIPTIRHEEWKYTNVMPLMAEQWHLAPNRSIDTSTLAEHLAALRSALPTDTATLVTVNGRFIQAMSEDLPNGVHVRTISREDPAQIPSTMGSTVPLDSAPFAAMNTIMFDAALHVHVDRNTAVAAPLHVVHFTFADEHNVISAPRLVVDVEEGAEATIVESFHTIGSHSALVLHVAEFNAARNGRLRATKIHDDVDAASVISYVGGMIHRDGHITTDAFCLGGAFVRNDVRLVLAEEHATAAMNGLSVLDKKEFADNHTVVDHTVPHCHSEELYKGVYDGASTGVFNGKIFVRPQAQKTEAYQSNRSVLLSDRAAVHAKPQLEIWADDVKCSHGATTGQLDEEAIFYLRSRGIGADDARAMMTYAFAAEVVERLPFEGLRLLLEERIAAKLGAAPFTEQILAVEEAEGA
jgi:Fe-S cluster assembly protein SufD